MWIALTPLPGFPGLQDEWTPEKPYFERAYDAGEQGIIRVRFVPTAVSADMNANIPLMPRQVATVASASLVDEEGAVILIDGRGIVRPSFSFTEGVRPGVTDIDEFLLTVAGLLADELVAFRAQATALALLIPPPMPEPEPVDEPEPEAADEGSMMRLAAVDETPEPDVITYGTLGPGENHVEEPTDG